jgi:hypothetical protein
MLSKSFHFWLLLFCSLFIAFLVISFAFQNMEVLFFGLFLAVLTPVIYTLLKYLFAVGSAASRPEKLKSRN